MTNVFITDFFYWIWSVSVMAAVTVVLILLLQRILRKSLKPRWHYLLWLLVIVRLVLPWGPESKFSIYNWISYPESIHVMDPTAQKETMEAATAAESEGVGVILGTIK
jgi:bla regulator protein BlaR1